MLTIEHNEFYELDADPVKNRIYVKIIGFWRNPDVVPHYLDHWEQALTHVTEPFTILADLREMKTHPQTVLELHAKAIELSKKAGTSYSAEVVEATLAERQMDRIYKEERVQENKFDNLAAANAYLDSVIQIKDEEKSSVEDIKSKPGGSSEISGFFPGL